jgi:hypothetical protein
LGLDHSRLRGGDLPCPVPLCLVQLELGLVDVLGNLQAHIAQVPPGVDFALHGVVDPLLGRHHSGRALDAGPVLVGLLLGQLGVAVLYLLQPLQGFPIGKVGLPFVQ